MLGDIGVHPNLVRPRRSVTVGFCGATAFCTLAAVSGCPYRTHTRNGTSRVTRFCGFCGRLLPQNPMEAMRVALLARSRPRDDAFGDELVEDGLPLSGVAKGLLELDAGQLIVAERREHPAATLRPSGGRSVLGLADRTPRAAAHIVVEQEGTGGLG